MNIKKEHIYAFVLVALSLFLYFYFGIDLSKILPKPSPTYKLFTNVNQCPEGYEAITTCEECNIAAKELRDEDGIECPSDLNTDTTYPSGCFKGGSNVGFGFNNSTIINVKGNIACKKI